jgi:hypothetical protein
VRPANRDEIACPAPPHRGRSHATQPLGPLWVALDANNVRKNSFETYARNPTGNEANHSQTAARDQSR